MEENALVMYEILKAGGFTTGGLNFDAKVRRQSTDKYDLFYGCLLYTSGVPLPGYRQWHKFAGQRPFGWP